MLNPPHPSLELLARLVGPWNTQATHPAMRGVVVHGTVDIEWLEGERFLIHRARTDHKDFPDSISIIGVTGQERAGDAPASARLTMNYYDSRGVSRVYDVAIDDDTVRYAIDVRTMAQRATGTFADAGDTIVFRWEMREDGGPWHDDLAITYRRRRA